MPYVEDMSVSTLPREAMVQFLEHLEVERNLSQLTIRNYGHYINRFIDWFEGRGHKDITKLDQDVMRKYRVYLNRYTDERGDPLSRKTQSYHIIALRSWLKYLVKNDLEVLQPEKVDLPKGESQHMQFLNTEQMERLLNQPDVTDPAGLRDRVILEVLFSTGLRVSELVGLNRDQVDTKRREFGVIGKGRRPRVVFLSEGAAVWLDRWLDSRSDDWAPVFIRFSGKQPEPYEDGEEMRLTSRSVQRIIRKYARMAKLSVKITPHGIRHTFATDLLSNGAGLRDVQEMLGHKNIATTQIYTHVTRPQLKKMHDEFHSDL